LLVFQELLKLVTWKVSDTILLTEAEDSKVLANYAVFEPYELIVSSKLPIQGKRLNFQDILDINIVRFERGNCEDITQLEVAIIISLDKLKLIVPVIGVKELLERFEDHSLHWVKLGDSSLQLFLL
jgi:hypothetical protein